MLLGERVRVDLTYPTLSAEVRPPGDARWRPLKGCQFHDLWSSDSRELAGMGLALIGNVCNALGRGEISPMADARLHLRLSPGHAPLACPWPGMPDDNPQGPIDLTQLPFQAAMFLDEDGTGKYRVDRLALMRRIEVVWIPWLEGALKVLV